MRSILDLVYLGVDLVLEQLAQGLRVDLAEGKRGDIELEAEIRIAPEILDDVEERHLRVKPHGFLDERPQAPPERVRLPRHLVPAPGELMAAANRVEAESPGDIRRQNLFIDGGGVLRVFQRVIDGIVQPFQMIDDDHGRRAAEKGILLFQAARGKVVIEILE